MDPEEIRQLIESGMPDAVVNVMSNDNTHFQALVVSEEFAGKRPLARHQLVYACLGSRVGNEIHALSISALTPAEYRERSNGEPNDG
ncbi:MAG: BolA family transcriptional regulator [Gammaproteobacteria bacterium]|nr:BolA family transcriptional regulator [Gammaproteobacteria bacterium]